MCKGLIHAEGIYNPTHTSTSIKSLVLLNRNPAMLKYLLTVLLSGRFWEEPWDGLDRRPAHDNAIWEKEQIHVISLR